MPSLSHSQRAMGKVSDWFKGPANSRVPPSRAAAGSATAPSGPTDRHLPRSARSAPAWITTKKSAAPTSGLR